MSRNDPPHPIVFWIIVAAGSYLAYSDWSTWTGLKLQEQRPQQQQSPDRPLSAYPQLFNLPIEGVLRDRPASHQLHVGNIIATVENRWDQRSVTCHFRESAVVEVWASGQELRHFYRWSDGFREWEIKCRLLS